MERLISWKDRFEDVLDDYVNLKLYTKRLEESYDRINSIIPTIIEENQRYKEKYGAFDNTRNTT